MHGISGSKEMRGIAAQEREIREALDEQQKNAATGRNPYKVYDLPFQHVLNRYHCLTWIPMCPQYRELKLPTLTCRNKKHSSEDL